LNDEANQELLPEAFSTRHEIMLMKESTFRLGVMQGVIHKNCKLQDVRKLRERVEGKKAKTSGADIGKSAEETNADKGPAKSAATSPADTTVMLTSKQAKNPALCRTLRQDLARIGVQRAERSRCEIAAAEYCKTGGDGEAPV
jgi:hypothetical protein